MCCFFPWRLNQSSEMKGRVDVLIHFSGLNVSFLTVSSLGQRPPLVIPVKMWFRDCWRAAFKVPCSSLWLNLQRLVPSAPHLSFLDALYFSCWSCKISKDGILPTLNIQLKRLSFVFVLLLWDRFTALGSQGQCRPQGKGDIIICVRVHCRFIQDLTFNTMMMTNDSAPSLWKSLIKQQKSSEADTINILRWQQSTRKMFVFIFENSNLKNHRRFKVVDWFVCWFVRV